MWLKRCWTFGGRAIAVAVLVGLATSACGGDGPTEPEAVSLSELFGTQLYTANGSPVGIGTLDNSAVIGIYFANLGCPACEAFTPVLVEAYDQLEQDGRSFEIVLVTAGITDSVLFEYMEDQELSWLAISPQASQANALAQRYDVRWVPTLVIIDSAGHTISMTGRDEVTLSGAAAYDAWLAAGTGS